MHRFVMNIFSYVIYMTLISTIIGVFILLIRRITNKRISPKNNYIIWMLFIITLIFPITIPSKLSIYNYFNISEIVDTNQNYIDALNNSEYYNKENRINVKYNIENNNFIFYKEYLIIIFSYIWLAFCVRKTFKKINEYRMINYIIGDCEICDKRLNDIFEECKRKLKIKKNIKLINQDIITTPALMGTFNVRILLTDDALEYDKVQLNAIFMHELSHYKRKDNIVKNLIMIAKCIYWFNPINLKIFKILEDDMELATDEMAIKQMNDEEIFMYSKILIKVAQSNLNKVEMVVGLSNGAKILDKRIDMIFDKQRLKKYSKIISIFTFVIVNFIIFVLYPTSYGKFHVPKMYLGIEGGKVIELKEKNSNDDYDIIKVNNNDNIKIFTENSNNQKYILFNKKNLENMKNEHGLIYNDENIIELENGKYIYEFDLGYEDNLSTKYAIKIEVE